MKRFFVFIFLLVSIELYASPRREEIYIRNHLPEKIIISAVFMEHRQETSWIQKIDDVEVLLSDYFKIYNVKTEYIDKLQPNQNIIPIETTKNYSSTSMYQALCIIDYFPTANIIDNPDAFLNDLEKLQDLPLKIKFQYIFKEFIIQDNNGNILYTLDTIDKVPLTYMYDQDDIILEIYPEKANE